MVRRVHRGFTLIEILVVLGIILLLLGMTLLGYMHIEKVAGERATRATLESLKAILNQYEASATLSAIEAPAGGTPAPIAAYANGGVAEPNCIYLYSGLNPPAIYASGGSITPGSPAEAGCGDVSSGATSRYIFPRKPSPNDSGNPNAVYLTGLIEFTFSRIPACKDMFAQFPANSLLSNNDRGITTNPPPVQTVIGQPWPLFVIDQVTYQPQLNSPLPVVLDAWQNPIVYVPSGGMHGVYLGGVMSSSTVQSNLIGTRMRVTSIDGRPFWASAGQDGNFSSGDDNIYSTQVRYTPE